MRRKEADRVTQSDTFSDAQVDVEAEEKDERKHEAVSRGFLALAEFLVIAENAGIDME